MTRDLGRRLFAEFLGSAFLAMVVIGSGIAAQRLSPGDIGLELFENAAATAVGLFAIIVMFGPVSGGHFNPVVSFVDAAFGGLRWRDASSYLPAQVGGCTVGAIIANLMFSLPAVSLSSKHRVVRRTLAGRGCRDRRASARHLCSRKDKPWIGRTGGGWRVHRWRVLLHEFNELCEPSHRGVGRMFSNTFAGIAPSSVPGYVGAEMLGGIVAVVIIKILYPHVTSAEAEKVVVPHGARRWPSAPSPDGNGAATSERGASSEPRPSGP